MSARNVGTVYAGRPAACIRWPRETKITPLRIPWLERALTPCGVLESTLLRTAPSVSAETMALQPILHDVAVYVMATETALAEKDATIDAQARTLAADLEFQRGETELNKTRANDLTDGLNACRAACVEAGETEGPLDDRIRRIVNRASATPEFYPSYDELRERAEKAEADAARWKKQWEFVSFKNRELTRGQPSKKSTTAQIKVSPDGTMLGSIDPTVEEKQKA